MMRTCIDHLERVTPARRTTLLTPPPVTSFDAPSAPSTSLMAVFSQLPTWATATLAIVGLYVIYRVFYALKRWFTPPKNESDAKPHTAKEQTKPTTEKASTRILDEWTQEEEEDSDFEHLD